MRYKFVFYGGRYECVMFLKSDIRANLCNSLSENLRVPVSTFQYLEWRGSRRANTAPISSLISNRGQSTRPHIFIPAPWISAFPRPDFSAINSAFFQTQCCWPRKRNADLGMYCLTFLFTGSIYSFQIDIFPREINWTAIRHIWGAHRHHLFFRIFVQAGKKYF